MKVEPLQNPAAGESVVGIAPPLAPGPAGTWNRRLHLYTGRTLSDTALVVEQTGRAGRLAARGQQVSAGVLDGLEVGLEQEPGAAPPRFFYQVAAGSGIAASGEDVVVPRGLRVAARDIPVFGQHSPFGALLDGHAALPHAGILVLEPVITELIGAFDPSDPCEQDPQNDAFADWQEADGCRLLLYPWPEDRLPLPAPGDRWRNRLAYAIFEAEAQTGPDRLLPWEAAGVPIALVGFDAAWVPLFADRYAVVRGAGKPRPRQALEGRPLLWQARLQQFAEQIADADLQHVPVAGLAAQFRYLPPVGLLPKDAVTVQDGRQVFFPASYDVEVVPVPLEQLDAAMAASAGLAPFDTFTADQVRVLVPVPQVAFEPALLLREPVDPSFGEAIADFIGRRGKWLLRRQDMRTKTAALTAALSGKPPTYPDPDPAALEPEEPATDPLDPAIPGLAKPEEAYGTEPHDGGLLVTALEALKTLLHEQTPVKSETAVPLDSLPAGITFPPTVINRIHHDPLSKRLVFRGAMRPQDRDELLKIAADEKLKAAIALLFDQSQNDEVSELERRGLDAFITYLDDKVRRANDLIDMGFLRVQTDIYRHRQLMLGTVAASRLATSPALASIAHGDSALATRADLAAFLASVKAPPPAPREVAPGTPADETRQVTPEVAARDLTRAGSAGGQVFLAGGMAQAVAAFHPVRFGRPVGRPQGQSGLEIGAEEIVARPHGPATSPIATETSQSALAGLIVGLPPGPRRKGGIGGGGTGAVGGAGQPPPPAPPKEEVIQQTPIIGKAYDFRTVTVAERIEQAPAPEAKSFSVASKYEVVNGLANLDLNLDDLAIPGFYDYDAAGKLVTEEVLVDPQQHKTKILPKEVRHSFAEIRNGRLAAEILSDRHDLDPVNGDEAAFFAAGVRALDNTTAALRVVEGRIQAYRTAIAACQETRQTLQDQVAAATARLNVIGDELTVVRHDVGVARALLAEEEARVAGINARRAGVLAEQVRFLAFVRPRLVDSTRRAPVRELAPGVPASLVPACLATDTAVPAPLRALVDLLREAPVRWLWRMPDLVSRFDRLDTLQQAMQSARLRAGVHVALDAGPRIGVDEGGRLGRALGHIVTAQHEAVSRRWTHTAALDLAAFAGESWLHARDHATDSLAPADLIAGDHGRSDVAQEAARALDEMARVATCLYLHCGDVLPAIRLAWAEALSEYDTPVDLRNLSGLPRWGDVAYLDRRELQALVDWLTGEVDTRWPAALGLLNDLLRVCILLASHAPVDQIIAGRLPQAATVKEGSRVAVDVPSPQVRVGHHVLLYSGAAVVARGVVEDLGPAGVTARIVQTGGKSVRLPQDARVQFAEADSFARNPLTDGRGPTAVRLMRRA